MSNDWRDFTPGRTGASVGQMADGEEIKVQVVSDPYREDTSESDNALHVPVVFLETPEGFTDMSGESVVVAGDAEGEPEEYNIINSSTTFFEALLEAFPQGSSIEGQIVNITARQEGDTFTRTYEIEAE